MRYKKTAVIYFTRSVEVEADSFEEAKELFDDGEWYDDEPQDVDRYDYFVEVLDEDGDFDCWDEIDEEQDEDDGWVSLRRD